MHSIRKWLGWICLSLALSLAIVVPIKAQNVDLPASTPEDSNIRLDSVHMIAASFGQVLRITEVYSFGNGGDEAFAGAPNPDAGGRQTSVFIPLPDEATGLAFPEDEAPDRFVEVEGGIWDTQLVPPGDGTSTVSFSYHLVVSGPKVSLERRFSYPVTALSILAVQPGLTLQSDQLQAEGSVTFEDEEYELFTGGQLGPATPLILDLVPVASTASEGVASTSPASVPAVSQPSAGSYQLLLRAFGFALVGLAVLGAAAYLVAVPRPAAEPSRRRPVSARSRRDRRLLAELADLEEALELGRIDEATYQRQWSEKVKALRAE